jgi:hypothetical protein
LGAGALAGALPLQSCRAQPVGGQFTPEAFGAAGDGITDDYDALSRLVEAVNQAGGGSIALAPGRTYFVDRYLNGGKPVAELAFLGCQNLTIEGNGARIGVKGDFRRDQPSIRGLAGLRFTDCHGVAVRRLELNGNVDKTLRTEAMPEPASHGLIFQSCFNVAIVGCVAHNFAGDGLYIRDSKRLGAGGTRSASRGFAVRNSRFLFNARQGLSVIQLRGGTFEDCEFSYTGFIDGSGAVGPYGGHSPGAGVDVEPNSTPTFGERVDVLTGDILFRRCRMIGNFGCSFVSGKYARGQAFQEQVRLDMCQLECGEGLTGGRDGFIFDVPEGEVVDCTLRMVDKIAYIGWYPQSGASPRFAGNRVSGRNRGPGHPLLVVRSTRGSPVIENNRFINQSGPGGGGVTLSIVAVGNPSAIVRHNDLVSEPAQ